MIRVFRAKRVDGIILAPTKISKAEVERLVDENYPLVTFDRYFPELPVPYVIVDNERSSYDLVRRLIAKGCRKIAVVTTNPHLRTMDMRRDPGTERSRAAVGDEPSGSGFRRVQKRIAVLDRRACPMWTDSFYDDFALEAFRYCYEKDRHHAGTGCAYPRNAGHAGAGARHERGTPRDRRQAVRLLLARIRSGGETSSQGESLVLPANSVGTDAARRLAWRGIRLKRKPKINRPMKKLIMA
ncbi:MAG: hypothetical protein ACLT1W_15800 [Alistipes onderdonkii]